MDYSCCIHDCQNVHGEHDQSAMERVKSDPKAAISAVLSACKGDDKTATSAGEPSDITNAALFRAIVNSIQSDARVSRCGAVELFVHCIVQGNEMHLEEDTGADYVAHPCHWETALQGIVYVLEVMQDDEAEARDELKESLIPIFEVVWRDLHRLLPPGGTAEFRRCLVTQVVLAFGNVLGLKDMLMENDMVVSLTMHCWMNMSTFPPNRQHALSAVHMLLADPESPNRFMAHPTTLEKAVKAVTIDMIALRLKEALLSEEIVDDLLASELRALCYFVITDMAFSDTFNRSCAYKEIAVALKRQADKGDMAFTPAVFHAGEQALTWIRNHVMEKHIYAEMATTGVFDVAAEGLIIADRNYSDHWYAFFDNIADNILKPCNDPNCCRRSSPDLVPSCRAAMERLYCRVLYTLRDNRESDGRAIVVWDKLAAALGICEPVMQEKWRMERCCSNPRCLRPDNNVGGRKQVKICVGCKSLFYCGRACQKSHWKEHKNTCKPPPVAKAASAGTSLIIKAKGMEADGVRRAIERVLRIQQ